MADCGSTRGTSTSRVKTPDGARWKRRAGGTSTAEAFLSARARFIEIWEDSAWNPWVIEDRADELEAARTIMRGWQRAERGFRQMTAEELDAQWKLDDEATERQLEAEHAERAELAHHYDEQRSRQRLLLLEVRGHAAKRADEIARLHDGTRFPSMGAAERQRAIEGAEEELQRLDLAATQLANNLVDPETVSDKHGFLPAQRRELLGKLFSQERQDAVRRLRLRIPELTTALPAVKGRTERTEARRELERQEASLATWLAIPPVVAEEMCSECPRPASWHLSDEVTPIGWFGMCPGWPGWRERLEQASRLLAMGAQRTGTSAASEPIKPLAVIPSGLPIGEVVERLQTLQSEHPGAEVRRGRGDRWEIWPTPHTP